MSEPAIGDYVLATKYQDGDPGDHFAVGWLKEIDDRYGQRRYMVVDGDGKQFRANGFCRCEIITAERGEWLVNHFREIEKTKLIQDDDGNLVGGRSVWDWATDPMEAPALDSEAPKKGRRK